MALQTACFLGVGLWAIIAFFGIAAIVVAGKSDEELGYKLPVEELIAESEDYESAPSISRQQLYEPGKSEHFST